MRYPSLHGDRTSPASGRVAPPSSRQTSSSFFFCVCVVLSHPLGLYHSAFRLLWETALIFQESWLKTEWAACEPVGSPADREGQGPELSCPAVGGVVPTCMGVFFRGRSSHLLPLCWEPSDRHSWNNEEEGRKAHRCSRHTCPGVSRPTEPSRLPWEGGGGSLALGSGEKTP